MSNPLDESARALTHVDRSVTVVVATFNGGAYIEEQLRSVCEQTLLPEHIIVSDDGSTDDTVARAQSVLSTYPVEFSILENPNRSGYSDNFLYGAAQAHSRYIAFCDQDDVWEANKLEECVAALARSRAVLCAHNARLINKTGEVIGDFRQGQGHVSSYPPNSLRAWFTFAGFTMVFERRLLSIVDPARRGRDFYRLHENLSHDSWITFLASSLGPVAFIAAPLARYRQHDRNLIGARRESLRRRLMLALGLPANTSLNRSAIARRWAAELHRVARREPAAELGSQAARSAKRWVRISAIELARVRMYAHHFLPRRAVAFAKLIGTGAYSTQANGLGGRYLPKDLLIGVLRLAAARV